MKTKATVKDTMGDRIRRARQQRGLSLAHLSTATGLSRSFLSQIERDVSQPSIESLRAVAGALGFGITELLDGATPDMAVTRASDRRILFGEGMGLRYYLLSPDMHRPVFMLLMEMDPGVATASRPLGHPGEETAFVLSGRIRIEYVDRAVELEAGDSVQFGSNVQHRLINSGDRLAQLVAAIGAPGF